MTSAPFGNHFGGILGGLAGGTAATTAQTTLQSGTTTIYWNQGCDTYNQAQWQGTAFGHGIDQTSILEWQILQNGTNSLTNNIYSRTAQWLGGIQGTATITNATGAWVDVFRYTQGVINSPQMWIPQLSPEELKAMELAEEKRRIEREAAKINALTLLKSQLNPDQLEQFEQTGHFDVRIKDRIYQITPGRKVHALHEKEKPFLCIAPYGYELPNEDVALAQKLLLEANEKEFLKTAIRWAA